MLGLIQDSGGLYYHLRAVIHSSAWQETRELVSKELRSWLAQLPQEEVLLIGPSGGYLFEPDCFKNIKKIIAYDRDLSSEFLFKLRHRQNVQWHNKELLKALNTEALPLFQILQANPDLPVVFCNILGQVSSQLTNHASWQQQLSHILSGRRYFSVHDRLSTNARIKAYKYSSPTKVSNAELAQVFSLEGGEYFDHETETLFTQESKYLYTSWFLTKKWRHILEVVSCP